MLRAPVLCLAASLCLIGCAFPRPLPATENDIAKDVAKHFQVVFPRATPGTPSLGLMRPRFGIPAIVEDAQTFSLVTLARGSERPVRAALLRSDLTEAEATLCIEGLPVPRRIADDCIPLSLTGEKAASVESGFTMLTYEARPTRPPAARGYDLLVRSEASAIERARRAVFYRAARLDKDALTVVQLSDVHIGRDTRVLERLDRVIRAVNALAPDLVVLTGDMAEQGRNGALEQWSADALVRLEAPVLVVLGNHDYGHFPRAMNTAEPDKGYYNFARAFHAYRLFHTTLGKWDFIGFDSGPSLFTPGVLTRGIDATTLGTLSAAIDRATVEGRGAVLFSHAPTRAALSSNPRRLGSNRLGSMHYGAKELERVFFAAGKRGQRTIHLSGHTHWSDLFFAPSGAAHFERVAFSRLPCESYITDPTLLVNAPSATRISFRTVKHASAFGFVVLKLHERSSQVRFELFDARGNALACAR